MLVTSSALEEEKWDASGRRSSGKTWKPLCSKCSRFKGDCLEEAEGQWGKCRNSGLNVRTHDKHGDKAEENNIRKEIYTKGG